MKKNINKFENSKIDPKIHALSLWKEGKSISYIAREVHKTRITIYRWIESAPKKLSKPSLRRRLDIDPMTRSRIIELYVVLGRPSIRILKEKLEEFFMIKKTESQLRRFLKKSGLDIFKPSLSFNTLIKWKISSLDD